MEYSQLLQALPPAHLSPTQTTFSPRSQSSDSRHSGGPHRPWGPPSKAWQIRSSGRQSESASHRRSVHEPLSHIAPGPQSTWRIRWKKIKGTSAGEVHSSEVAPEKKMEYPLNWKLSLMFSVSHVDEIVCIACSKDHNLDLNWWMRFLIMNYPSLWSILGRRIFLSFCYKQDHEDIDYFLSISCTHRCDQHCKFGPEDQDKMNESVV